MGDGLKLFQATEEEVLKKTCECHYEKDFIVYKHKKSERYRLGNGILIINSDGRTLKDWEDVFDKFFDKEIYQHKTFTFIDDSNLGLLKAEGLKAKYKEINILPVEICYSSPFGEKLLSHGQKVCKIENTNGWENYRRFIAELHPDNDWVFNEGFDTLRDTSESVNIERFFIREEKSGKMLSTLGLFKCGQITRIENMETHPDFRRKGLALHLLTFALRYSLRELNVKGLILTCSNDKAATNLYKKFGFNVIGRKVELVNY